MKKMMEAVRERWPLAAIALMMTTIGITAWAGDEVFWITRRSVITWPAANDPLRSAWNVVLATPAITNLPASAYERGISPTNGIVKWFTVLDFTTNRFNAGLLMAGLPSPGTNYVVWVSASTKEGVFSDWSRMDVFDPTPGKLAIK